MHREYGIRDRGDKTYLFSKQTFIAGEDQLSSYCQQWLLYS